LIATLLHLTLVRLLVSTIPITLFFYQRDRTRIAILRGPQTGTRIEQADGQGSFLAGEPLGDRFDGGSWIASQTLIQQRDWKTIARQAADANRIVAEFA